VSVKGTDSAYSALQVVDRKGITGVAIVSEEDGTLVISLILI
jgi:hypothetical protein